MIPFSKINSNIGRHLDGGIERLKQQLNELQTKNYVYLYYQISPNNKNPKSPKYVYVNEFMYK